MEQCSKPFEPDLGETSGGKLKEYGICFQPAHFSKNEWVFIFGKKGRFLVADKNAMDEQKILDK
jgi:hypothetical protein